MPLRNLNPEVNFRFYGRHNSAANRRIATKFGRWMQNDIPKTTQRSKS